ncbi:MAG: hypothetical protein LUG19_02375, partial [Desulfovibrio sp.]|uniref:hypothetical protein n=1 Tax=Desulfovibrio sp. TaxID=885 RepID=UPI002585A722
RPNGHPGADSVKRGLKQPFKKHTSGEKARNGPRDSRKVISANFLLFQLVIPPRLFFATI